MLLSVSFVYFTFIYFTFSFFFSLCIIDTLTTVEGELLTSLTTVGRELLPSIIKYSSCKTTSFRLDVINLYLFEYHLMLRFYILIFIMIKNPTCTALFTTSSRPSFAPTSSATKNAESSSHRKKYPMSP